MKKLGSTNQFNKILTNTFRLETKLVKSISRLLLHRPGLYVYTNKSLESDSLYRCSLCTMIISWSDEGSLQKSAETLAKDLGLAKKPR